MNRVLAYWRAGGYHADPIGLGRICSGKTCQWTDWPGRAPANGTSEPVINHETALTYAPDSSLLVTNRISVTSHCCHCCGGPSCPTGWTLESVSGDRYAERWPVRFCGSARCLPSPVSIVYAVRVPVGEKGPREIRGEVEYLTLGMMNPATMFASPDPVMVYWSPHLRMRLQPGKIVLTWPTGDPAMVVETTDNLDPPIHGRGWTNTPVVIDDQNTIEIEIDRATQVLPTHKAVSLGTWDRDTEETDEKRLAHIRLHYYFPAAKEGRQEWRPSSPILRSVCWITPRKASEWWKVCPRHEREIMSPISCCVQALHLCRTMVKRKRLVCAQPEARTVKS